jgi:hypothetical protein
MSKPIFIIRFPESSKDRQNYLEILEQLRRTMRDYYVLGFADNKTERVEFECYNPDNAAGITLQELEQKVTDSLK